MSKRLSISEDRTGSDDTPNEETESVVEHIRADSVEALRSYLTAGVPAERAVAPVDSELNTPLHHVALCGAIECCKLLLYHGALPDVYNASGVTPLITGIVSGHKDVVAHLLNNGASVELTSGKLDSPLNIACKVKDVVMATLLLEAGAAVNAPTTAGGTVLNTAAESGSAALVETLLRWGASPDVVKVTGTTPLMSASQRGFVDVVRLLIDAHVDVNVRKVETGSTALFVAAQNGHKDVVELLLRNGAEPNDIRRNRATALYMSVQNGHAACVDLLLQYGADPSICRYMNTSPLLMACKRGYLSIVRSLVSAGANIDVVKDNGSTPLATAVENGHSDVARYLLSLGAKVTRVPGTASHVARALERCNSLTVRDLLEAGGWEDDCGGVLAGVENKCSPALLTVVTDFQVHGHWRFHQDSFGLLSSGVRAAIHTVLILALWDYNANEPTRPECMWGLLPIELIELIFEWLVRQPSYQCPGTTPESDWEGAERRCPHLLRRLRLIRPSSIRWLGEVELPFEVIE